MEITPQEQLQGTQLAARRLTRLCDYQEDHIAALEQELQAARNVIESLQAEASEPEE